MRKVTSITFQVIVDVWEDENYRITVSNFGNVFYVLTDLQRKGKGKVEPEKFFEFIKKLKGKYPDYENKVVIFERKGKLYYYKKKKGVDKNGWSSKCNWSSWLTSWWNSGTDKRV